MLRSAWNWRGILVISRILGDTKMKKRKTLTKVLESLSRAQALIIYLDLIASNNTHQPNHAVKNELSYCKQQLEGIKSVLIAAIEHLDF